FPESPDAGGGPVAEPAAGGPGLPTFGAHAEVQTPPGQPIRLSLRELRELPGSFGEPYRAIDSLPGVVPIVSGVPYVYVRGAPPSGTLYVYDEIPLPALFHLALGPSVIHPAMIGDVDLFSGVPPARYGRFIGGAVVGEGPERARPERISGEVELRAVDLSAMLRAPAGEGSLAVAGRYGYPGLLLSIFSPEVSLAYWDYQLRFDQPIGRADRFELVWLGSYDAIRTKDGGDSSNEDDLELQFHRLEARFIRRRAETEFGAALRLGFERSVLGGALRVTSARVGSRAWLRTRLGGVRLHAGLDSIGVAGSLEAERVDEGEGGEMGPVQDDPLVAGAAARSKSGLFAELAFEASSAIRFELGLRADLWLRGHQAEFAIDPRARMIWALRPGLELQAAAGLLHQPAVFFIPLPGLADIAIERGLQTAAQTELTTRVELGGGLELETQLFYHHYRNLLFLDLFASTRVPCGDLECDRVQLPDRVPGHSYGLELFLRRDPSERLSGWISYTLSRSTVEIGPIGFGPLPPRSIEYTPSYDVRHVLNVVASYNPFGGLRIGLRVHARSGRSEGSFYLNSEPFGLARHEQRLPWFVRIDARIGYRWRKSWGGLLVALDWMNVMMAEEPIGIRCRGLGDPPDASCPVEYAPAIFFPNLSVAADF
ncbi:MAG: TonB-dependent receptor, partial [Myxococcales bacterium]|nr:TonB-dependent receptor [Myxococcales bacterium]